MFITSNIDVVAWSDKGDAVLVESSSSGPEGGGSLEYVVFGPKVAVQARLSEDLSPGDGSTPEHISAGICRTDAKALAAAVAAAGFTGVEVRPEKCSGDRAAVVRTPPARPLAGSGDVTVVLHDDHAIVKTAGGELKIDLAKHDDADVWRAPNGPLLVIRIHREDGWSIDAFVTVPVDAAPAQVRFPQVGPIPGL